MSADEFLKVLDELEGLHALVANHRNEKVLAGSFDPADERLWESAMNIYWSHRPKEKERTMTNHEDRILALEGAVLDLHRNLRTIVRTIDHIGSVIESMERKHSLEHQIEAMRRSLTGGNEHD